MATLTVLTPTYNRADYLQKLYDSLVKQTGKDFDWLIVDDGSMDNTEEVIQGFIDAAAGLSISVVKQCNGGKHRALNNGISRISSELTFIVDSDDTLPENAIETILEYHKKYTSLYDVRTGERISQNKLDKRSVSDNPDRICGYSFLRCGEDGSVNTAYFPSDELIGTFKDVRINGGIGGDKAEVYFTAVLGQYPFPEFDGEKFLPEDAVWMRISRSYKMVHINKNVYTCEYHDNGLTKSGHAMKIHSPRGMMLRSEEYLCTPGVKLKVHIKMMMLYIIYARFAGVSHKELDSKIRDTLLFCLCYVPAQVVYYKWKSETGA